MTGGGDRMAHTAWQQQVFSGQSVRMQERDCRYRNFLQAGFPAANNIPLSFVPPV